MRNAVSRLAVVAACVMALLAVPLASSCSSVVTAVNSLTEASSSSSASAPEVESVYYLGIDEDGYLALYKGQPGDGSEPIRTTDIVAADLHETVVEGLEEGIVFDSFNDAIERISAYREAAKATADAREAAGTPEEEAQEAAKQEAEQLDAAAEREAEESAAPEPAPEPAPAPADESKPDSASAPDPAPAPDSSAASDASDETAPAGEFWGVWLDTFQDLGEAYACADRAKEQGFASEVFEVTNWDGASYVVGAGEFAKKSEAQAVLSRALELGYSKAYLHTAARQ